MIVYVGGQVGGFAGKTGDTTVNLTLTGGVDSLPVAADLVVIAYAVGSTADRALTIRNATEVDYTLAGVELYQNDTFDSNLRVAYRFMPETPETSFVLSGTGSNSDAGAYTVHVFRGVHPTTPLDVLAVTAGGINSRLANPGAITPVTPGAWLYIVGAAAGATGGIFTVPYLTALLATSISDTNDAMVGAGYRAWTIGAYDPVAFTGGGNATNNDSWNAVTLALRPAPEPSPMLGTSSPAFSPAAVLLGKGALLGASAPEFSTAGAISAVELLRVTWAQIEIPESNPAGPIAAALTVAFGQDAALRGKGVLAGAVATAFAASGIARGRTALTVARAPAWGLSWGASWLEVWARRPALAFRASGAMNAIRIFGEASLFFSTGGALRSLGALAVEPGSAWGESWGTAWGFTSGAPAPLTFAAAGTLTAASPGATLAGTVPLVFAHAALIRARGTLVGSAVSAFATAALLRGRGTLAGSTVATFGETALLRGSSDLVGTTGATFAAVATMAGRGTLAGACVPAFGDAALLRGRSASVGQSSLAFTVSGLTTLPSGTIVGTAAQAFSTAGTLRGKGALVGQAASVFSDTAVLRGKAPVAGLSAAAFSTVGAITGKVSVVGQASAAFSTAASLIGMGSLLGQAASVFSDTGTIRGPALTAGTSTVTFSLTGQTEQPGPIAGTAQVSFGEAAVLMGWAPAEGLSEVTWTLSGALVIAEPPDSRGFITDEADFRVNPITEIDEEVTSMSVEDA